MRQVALPSPGGPRELAAFVGEVAGWPLDRDRPLWQMWVAEGLEHGHVALIAKVHHAAIDGASGVEVLANLVDLEPTPVTDARPTSDEPWQADRVPTDVEMIGASMVSIARQPVRMARAVVHLGQVAGPARHADAQRGRAHGRAVHRAAAQLERHDHAAPPGRVHARSRSTT